MLKLRCAQRLVQQIGMIALTWDGNRLLTSLWNLGQSGNLMNSWNVEYSTQESVSLSITLSHSAYTSMIAECISI